MPTYDYKCQNCGHAFEKFNSIMAAPIKKCPVCGKNTVKRLIGTGAGIIFKGGGFYETDYRSEGYKKAEKAESGGGESKGEAKAEGKADAKSDTKPDAKPAGGEAKVEAPKAEPVKPKPEKKPAAKE